MLTTTDTTSRMVDYILATTADSLPPPVRREALRTFVNIFGCTVGGSRHDAVAMTEAALLPFAGEAQATLIGRSRKSDTLSLYQWVAAALLRGKAGVAEGTDAAIADKDITALRDRITAVADPGIAPDATDITITLRDGVMLKKQVVHCIGSKDRPMTDREIEIKFEGLTEGILMLDKTKALIAECWRLESLADAADVVRATV